MHMHMDICRLASNPLPTSMWQHSVDWPNTLSTGHTLSRCCLVAHAQCLRAARAARTLYRPRLRSTPAFLAMFAIRASSSAVRLSRCCLVAHAQCLRAARAARTLYRPRLRSTPAFLAMFAIRASSSAVRLSRCCLVAHAQCLRAARAARTLYRPRLRSTPAFLAMFAIRASSIAVRFCVVGGAGLGRRLMGPCIDSTRALSSGRDSTNARFTTRS